MRNSNVSGARVRSSDQNVEVTPRLHGQERFDEIEARRQKASVKECVIPMSRSKARETEKKKVVLALRFPDKHLLNDTLGTRKCMFSRNDRKYALLSRVASGGVAWLAFPSHPAGEDVTEVHPGRCAL